MQRARAWRVFGNWALSAGLLGLAGCASLLPHAEKDVPAPILTGHWQGDLFLPKQLESVRAREDRACDRVQGSGMKLAITRPATDQVTVEAHFSCQLQGRAFAVRDIPAATYELRGEDLWHEGHNVGRATAMYFALETSEGNLRVVKYPTWEQVSYQLTNQGPPPTILAAHFEDTGTWSDETPGQPVSRLPASVTQP